MSLTTVKAEITNTETKRDLIAEQQLALGNSSLFRKVLDTRQKAEDLFDTLKSKEDFKDFFVVRTSSINTKYAVSYGAKGEQKLHHYLVGIVDKGHLEFKMPSMILYYSNVEQFEKEVRKDTEMYHQPQTTEAYIEYFKERGMIETLTSEQAEKKVIDGMETSNAEKCVFFWIDTENELKMTFYSDYYSYTTRLASFIDENGMCILSYNNFGYQSTSKNLLELVQENEILINLSLYPKTSLKS